MTKLEIPNYQRTHNDTSLVIRVSGFRHHGVFRHSSIAWGLFIIRHSAVYSVLLFAGAGSVVLAAEGDNAARSLDQQLFEDLDNELLEDLEAESHGSSVSPTPRDLSPENKGAADPLDGDLLDQLGEGEDFTKSLVSLWDFNSASKMEPKTSLCSRLFRPPEASVPQVVSGIAFGVFFGPFWHPFGSFRAHFRSLLAKGCRKEPLDLLACSFLILHAVQRSKGRPKKGGTAVAGRMALRIRRPPLVEQGV